ncbi:hypothetical protein TREMEDRAFT_64153 [Tremella mesenterica DSM 1558]|uniref:uncharacterized protein n=1 Tax=Tremella mesenterica (strain ATCC 24925 / CBS 8224 / DSM 1558 / NBRC 9311 / NRRL Y-6157 / RJB 2259-6 / UBC 559-6) TaxID=578456 RepID=UPI0003F49052|nr:uncharacterized protein TREMEDRAFT_64153 [Tremella mesenterica DSM 1558]EIW67565.1 hypothetical protein TREMEDRAFT_64153 [Tremella mesenterica DSM 1558]
MRLVNLSHRQVSKILEEEGLEGLDEIASDGPECQYSEYYRTDDAIYYQRVVRHTKLESKHQINGLIDIRVTDMATGLTHYHIKDKVETYHPNLADAVHNLEAELFWPGSEAHLSLQGSCWMIAIRDSENGSSYEADWYGRKLFQVASNGDGAGIMLRTNRDSGIRTASFFFDDRELWWKLSPDGEEQWGVGYPPVPWVNDWITETGVDIIRDGMKAIEEQGGSTAEGYKSLVKKFGAPTLDEWS